MTLAEYRECKEERRRLKRQLAQMILTRCVGQAQTIHKRFSEIERRCKEYEREHGEDTLSK